MTSYRLIETFNKSKDDTWWDTLFKFVAGEGEGASTTKWISSVERSLKIRDFPTYHFLEYR